MNCGFADFLGSRSWTPPVCLRFSHTNIGVATFKALEREEREFKGLKFDLICGSGPPIGQWWELMQTGENDIILQILAEQGFWGGMSSDESSRVG